MVRYSFQTLKTNCTMVDINDANGKPKSKASPTSTMLPFYASPPSINISHPFNRKEAGHHWPDEDKGEAPKAKHPRKGSMFAKPDVCEGKKAYVDRVNDLKKAAIDTSDRAETYLLAVKAVNKSPSWELPEATELFKLMHNKSDQLLGDFSYGIMQRAYQEYLWNRNQTSGFKSDDSDDSTPSGNATRGA